MISRFCLSAFFLAICCTRGFSQSASDSSATKAIDTINKKYSSLPPESSKDKLSVYHIAAKDIDPGSDKNGSLLLKRLAGITVLDQTTGSNIQSLNIAGLGERYNQVFLNGAILGSVDPLINAYQLSLIPSEAIESAGVERSSNGAIPASFSGGNINIVTKDLPAKNFLYIQAGGGWGDKTKGKDFKGDERGDLAFIGFPGSGSDLPSEFPVSSSQTFLNQKNIQEQVQLSRLLRNQLKPSDQGTAGPDEKIMIGFGRTITKKNGVKIGVVAFLNQQSSERIYGSTVQAVPDIAANPFPFDPAKQLIRTQSENINYRYASHLAGIFNATVLFGHNKVSFKNFAGSTHDNTFSQGSLVAKANEDPIAHSALNYITQNGRFWNTQLSGNHLLGAKHLLKMDWQAAYTFFRNETPDQRNFLLRQDPTDEEKYAIANQLPGMDLTRSGRSWKQYTDHHFTGMFNLSVPFNVFDRDHLLAGGIFIESLDRKFDDNLFMAQGTGYYKLDELIAPDRYYPGGLQLTNYYVRSNITDNAPIVQNNRGSYRGSSNIGAAYVRLENQLTAKLKLNWGLRLESGNQLVSNIQYYYVPDYKNPQYVSLDANTNVIRFNLLPTVKLQYQLTNKIQVNAGWFKTVSRPRLQELSSYGFYDAASFMVKTGNPYLRNSSIQNLEAGIHWKNDQETSIAFTGFYKKIDEAIENVLSPYAAGIYMSTPQNMPEATVRGISADLKIRLSSLTASSFLSGISLVAGGTWLKAMVDEGPVRSLVTPLIAAHQLTGSPDYAMNAGLVIQNPVFPVLTVLYNRTGDYTTASGSGTRQVLANGNTISAVADYRMQGKDQLDLQIAQKFFRSRIQLIAGVQNLTGTDYTEYQDLNGNKKLDAPLVTTTGTNGDYGYFQSGTDNTVLHIKGQRTFYFTLSYLFN